MDRVATGVLPVDRVEDGVLPVARAVLPAAVPVWAAAHLGSGCAESCRLFVERIGYTSYHLPKKIGLLPKKEDAIPASLAARIAFSSLCSLG